MLRWTLAWILVPVVASVLSAAQNQSALKEVEVAPGIAVSYPDNWSPAMRYRSGIEFVTPPPQSGRALPLAKLLIRIETGKDHAEAVSRLSDIAKEINTPVKVLARNGWPAIERQYTAPVPRTDQRGVIGKIDGTETLAVWIKAAIAVDNLVVNEDAIIAQSANAELVSEADKILRSITVSRRTAPQQVNHELKTVQQAIRPSSKAVRPARQGRLFIPPRRFPPPTLVAPKAVLLPKPAGSSEPELAASNDGQTVVVGSIGAGISFSSDGGAHFMMAANNGGVQNPRGGQDGDFSVAYGQSGTFYISELTYPDQPIMNRSVGVATSSTGQDFVLRSQAIYCPPNTCSVDQPHIAADRFNPGLNGKDQVYVVWQDDSAITCSTQGGQDSANGQPPTWITPVPLAGANPRVTVGQDGLVYAISRPQDSRVIYLERFNSCNEGLQPIGMPQQVAPWADDEARLCPLAGLDRCSRPLASPTVAVDDTDPSHVYLAFANTTVTGNEDIWVLDSTDGGQHFQGQVKISPQVVAHRFMPWMCTTKGAAIVSWYDRSTATQAQPDLTNYMAAAVTGRSATLTAWQPVNVSGNPDPQCATRFPWGVDVSDNVAVSCNPPQFIDKCSVSNQECSDSIKPPMQCPPGHTCTCPLAGEKCVVTGAPGGGGPKYGDYSGNGCAAGKFFALWTSATTPPGIPGQLLGPSEFVSVLSQTVTVNNVVVPPTSPGTFDLRIDGIAQAGGVGNGGSTGPILVGAGVHSVIETGDQTNCYSTQFSGDCDRSGMVPVNLGDNKTCTITNRYIGSIPMRECLADCKAEYLDCLQSDDLPGGATPARCRPGLNRCKKQCQKPCNR
jgi:hypothetical protein